MIPITGNLAANTANTPKETTVYPAFFILSSQGISSSKQSTIKQPKPIPNAFAPITLALVPYLIGFFGALNFLNLKTVFLNSWISSTVLSTDFSLVTLFLNSGWPLCK